MICIALITNLQVSNKPEMGIYGCWYVLKFLKMFKFAVLFF